MKVRVLSAILLAIVIVPLLVIGEQPFVALMSALSVCGLYEMLHVRESKKPFPLLLKIIAYVMVVAFCTYNCTSIEFQSQFDYRVMALLLFTFLSPVVFINDSEKYNINDALFLIGSLLFIGLSLNLIVIIRNYDINYIIYLVLITAISDTFALITGALIGDHKLCPKISPKKTIEGLLGGVFMGTVVATSFYYTVINSHVSLCSLK